MNRLIASAIIALALSASACERTEERQPSIPAPTQLQVTADEVTDAVLDDSDVGSSWSEEDDPVPSTVQIGGRVGPANVKDAEAEAISAFTKKEGTAYLTTDVFLVDTPEVAQAVMLAHRQADSQDTWTQERKDGGGARFKRVGTVEDLPELGDEMYSARLSVTVRDAEGEETKRKIQYVAFRVNRLLVFVIAQNAKVGDVARRQEQKLVSLAA